MAKTFNESEISFFNALKHSRIGDVTYYHVIVPEIDREYYFGINPVDMAVTYFYSADFSIPLKTIKFNNNGKNAYEIVGDMADFNTKVAAILFLKAAYHVLKKNEIPDDLSYFK